MFRQEIESNAQNTRDPPISRHRPSSAKTQDISHLIVNIFKDFYTSEVIGKEKTGIKRSWRGDNSYHDKYLQELNQVHATYSKQIRDADMLEKHIIQARAQATAAEDAARARATQDVGQAYSELVLPPVKSTFKWCLDNSLLKSNNLLCPEDYIANDIPLRKAPRGKSASGFASPTIAYNMHTCTLPKDDGYDVMPHVDVTKQGILGSEHTFTFSSTPEMSSLAKKIPSEDCQAFRATRIAKLRESVRAAEKAALLRLRKPSEFVRNPRFLPPQAHCGGKSLIQPMKKVEREVMGRKALLKHSGPDEPVPVFLADPPFIFFSEYRVGQVYETTVELRNVTTSSRHVRVIPPITSNFFVGLGKFPGEGGMVAPGMSCQYTVRFAPDSLTDFEDFLLIETQAPHPLVVPIEARRPPPILTLPRVLDCGYCLVGGVKIMEFLCCNEGLSDGTFCIMPKNLWPASNLRSVVTASFSEQPPFAVSPSLFRLFPGQTTLLEVVFFPITPDTFSEIFSIVCDNCQVKDFTIQGTGQLVTLQLVYVTDGEDRPAPGELCDLTAEHLVRFGTTNPYGTLQKQLIIRNNTHLELPFYWQVMKPNLQPYLPGQNMESACLQYLVDMDTAFGMSPRAGLLLPHQNHEFLLTYCPKEIKDYHSVFHLVLRDIPDFPDEDNSKGTTYSPEKASLVNDAIVMEIEVKGSTEPYQVLMEPYAIHFPGDAYVGIANRKRFKMWNRSKCCIQFQWDRISNCHIMEVEPIMGEIEVNECCDMELVLTGGRPGLFECSLWCYIRHHDQPFPLAVQASFKGPELSISVPSVDFGLMKLGDAAQSRVLISNTSQLEASWRLQECAGQQQIVVKPCQGVLPPLASCHVEILFRPVACHHFHTVLELAVENGTGSHLSVQADVQVPRLCLLNCWLMFPDSFVGVPSSKVATLFNQTLLPTHFSWRGLHGSQASLCSATFAPCVGTVGPNAKLEVLVEFTAHTDAELTEVTAICDVEGMQEPLIVAFSCKAKMLHVSYSLPDRADTEGRDPSLLELDFGDSVILRKAVTEQLLIRNHTAITASFSVEAQYFTVSRGPSPPTDGASRTGHRPVYRRRPLHSVQAKEVQDKAQKEFESSLLAEGKGAAFLIQPSSGMLKPFGIQTLEVTAFSNMWGEYRDQLICKVGDLEPVSIPMKMTVIGCPLYFQMIGPQLENQTQGPIIRFGTHISGGDTVSRPLRINNISPYNIRLDWEIFSQERDDRKLLDVVVTYGEAFPLKDVDGNEVLGDRFGPNDTASPHWVLSDTPSPGTTSSSLGSENTTVEGDEEHETVANGCTELLRKLISLHVRIHEGIASDCPYCITPQQLVIPAGGSASVHVSFTPLTLSSPTCDYACMAFALAFMSLDSKVATCVPGKVRRAQGLEVEPLRLDMQANVKAAVLTVEMDEEQGLEFYSIASDLLPVDPEKEVLRQSVMTRSMHLRNTSEMPLYFTLRTQQPFSVLLPQRRNDARCPHSPPEDPPYSVLQSQHAMQVKVAFLSSQCLLSCSSSPDEQAMSPATQLTVRDAGERTLCLQHSLLIEYSNGSVQSLPLCAYLTLPTLYLTVDSLDFGTCYVGESCVREVFLHNRGHSSSYWMATTAAQALEGSSSFEVTPDRGILRPEHPVTSCRCPLTITFKVRDTSEARATITIRGILGEVPVSLQVQGTGSSDEKFATLQPEG